MTVSGSKWNLVVLFVALGLFFSERERERERERVVDNFLCSVDRRMEENLC